MALARRTHARGTEAESKGAGQDYAGTGRRLPPARSTIVTTLSITRNSRPPTQRVSPILQ